MIYAELKTDTNRVIEKGVFMNVHELALADQKARTQKQRWSGSFEANVATNRYRHDKCMFCGAGIGQDHKDCIEGKVNTMPYEK